MERDSEPNPRWRLCSTEAIARRDWDGEVILYDERNGATHLIGAGATLLLQALALAPTPLTVPALIGAAFPTEADVTDRPSIEAAILQLERSGLIERLRP